MSTYQLMLSRTLIGVAESKGYRRFGKLLYPDNPDSGESTRSDASRQNLLEVPKCFGVPSLLG